LGRILVVDDEEQVQRSFARLLSSHGHDVIAANDGRQALARLAEAIPELLIMDIHLPGMNGLEILRQVSKHHPQLPVIIMTASGTTETAITATKMGAFDYQLKPVDPAQMLKTVDHALECRRLMAAGQLLPARRAAAAAREVIIGNSAAMQQVYKAIGRVAPTDATVLIRGETGTGKELVARAIYEHSRRQSAPLIMVNCAAIPETLLEGELFGHEKGAFTGATNRRIGKFEQASNGTIFLDEIGDMPLSTQVKILRVLQGKRIERVGGKDSIPVDVRIFAATNRDLEQAIADAKFRDDLYHRLNVWTITVPPLRQRRDDIPALVAYFLARFSAEHNIETPVLADDAMQVLCNHRWPGNVRELEHCINRALIFTCGFPIRSEDVRYVLKIDAGSESLVGDRGGEQEVQHLVQDYLHGCSGANTHSQFMAMIDKQLVAEALNLCNGNKTQAARRLGITRPTLQAKLQKYGDIGGKTVGE